MSSLKANRKCKWLRGHLLFWCFSAEMSCWSSRDGDSLVASVAIFGIQVSSLVFTIEQKLWGCCQFVSKCFHVLFFILRLLLTFSFDPFRKMGGKIAGCCLTGSGLKGRQVRLSIQLGNGPEILMIKVKY